MSDHKGFSLMELVVVMVIIGILAVIAIPNYYTSMEQGMATAAKNNLVNIYNAQKSYYYTNGNYCITTGNSSDCGYSIGSLNTNLASINQSTRSLNIIDSNFNYQCVAAGSGFSCTATNTKDTNFKITLTGNSPIVLIGGSGCTPGSMSSCNPSCSDTDNSAYCPN